MSKAEILFLLLLGVIVILKGVSILPGVFENPSEDPSNFVVWIHGGTIMFMNNKSAGGLKGTLWTWRNETFKTHQDDEGYERFYQAHVAYFAFVLMSLTLSILTFIPAGAKNTTALVYWSFGNLMWTAWVLIFYCFHLNLFYLRPLKDVHKGFGTSLIIFIVAGGVELLAIFLSIGIRFQKKEVPKWDCI